MIRYITGPSWEPADPRSRRSVQTLTSRSRSPIVPRRTGPMEKRSSTVTEIAGLMTSSRSPEGVKTASRPSKLSSTWSQLTLRYVFVNVLKFGTRSLEARVVADLTSQ